MDLSFSQYLAVIHVLTTAQGMTVDDAIAMAAVPMRLQDQLRIYLRGPVEIRRPDVLVDGRETIEFCAPLTGSQPYMMALRNYLIDARRRDRVVVENIEATSLELVQRLPRPDAADRYAHRGLVVGYIQSGKTASMASLIARAADQGYRLFIVLAGLYKDLREQTQRRLDQEITGRSERPSDGPFVQHDPGVTAFGRLTVAGLEGDFRQGSMDDVNLQSPKLAVLKKNVKVLERFVEWLGTSPARFLPALVIDDEADQASINTNYGRFDDDGEPIDPSRTNQKIRALLRTLPKYVYVGYTATPFANVLIDSSIEDLYPKDFIVSLPEPEGYFGPRQLFGLGMPPSDLSPQEPADPQLDVIRPIPDEQLPSIEALAPGAACPPAITDALLAFVLSSCARLARGQEHEHFSMFFHPSFRQDIHYVYREIVRKEVDFLRRAVASAKKYPDLHRRAEEMWEKDFAPVTAADPQNHRYITGFRSIWAFAKGFLDSVEIKVLNMGSDDQLEYASGPARRYIVIGGNRLSRGLTLEGLSVSFFMRDTNYYDTLLQMGRWFGFRAGFADLTRIYVEDRMADMFAELARVEFEFREDLKKYAQQPYPPSPLELMPRIRMHQAMAVTSPMKMGAGRPEAVDFPFGAQTVSFPLRDLRVLRANQELARSWLRGLGKTSVSANREGMHIWQGVPAAAILEFMGSYGFSKDAKSVNRDYLTQYINRRIAAGELTTWDVVIPPGNPRLQPYFWTDDVFSRRVTRRRGRGPSIGVLSSPPDIDQWWTLAGRSETDPSVGCLMLYLVDRASGAGTKRALFPDLAQAEDVLGFVLQWAETRMPQDVVYVSQPPPASRR
jgi:hypothetical protein